MIREHRPLRVGDVVVATIAIPALRVPPGSMVRVGTHGVIIAARDEGNWLVRFDTGYVTETQDDELELHMTASGTRPRQEPRLTDSAH